MYKKGIQILKYNPKEMKTNTIIVEGMTCNHCKSNVENKLRSLEGIYNVKGDISTGEVDIDGIINIEAIKSALEDIGYQFKGVLRAGQGKNKNLASTLKKRTSIFFTIVMFFFLSFSGIQAQEKAKVDTIDIVTSAQCSMCKKAIEEALIFEKGVKIAELDMQTKVLQVIYKPSKTAPEKIRAAINKIGYDADDTKGNEKAYQKLPACCKKPWDAEYKKHK